MKVAVLIDGGHLRVLCRKVGFGYTPEFIEKVAWKCLSGDEILLRALYYDCAPYKGFVKKPVSGDQMEFKGSDVWLNKLAEKDFFAVRTGVLKFRGFKPKKVPVSKEALTDDDFVADFEQKGVDMRIGLDIANFSNERSVDRIILISADTDCVPAMKYARIEGLQVVLARFDKSNPAPNCSGTRI